MSKTFHGPRALAMPFLGFVFFLLMQIYAWNATLDMNLQYKPLTFSALPCCVL